MFISKNEIEHIYMCLKECKKNITSQDTINRHIIETLKEQNKIINELTRIVQNQPLIKKYQKTLDILLKNAQN